MKMDEYSVTLLLKTEQLRDEQIAALYDAAPDATVSERDNRVYVSFDRTAPDFLRALISAITDVGKALPQIPIAEVQPSDLVYAADIAARTTRSRESISQLVNGERGAGGFPLPAYVLGGRSLWRWSEVEPWFAAHEGRLVSPSYAHVIAAVNAVLAAEDAVPHLSRDERAAMHEIMRHLEGLVHV